MDPFHTVFGMIRPMAWRLVKQWVRRSFPTVQTISTQALADWIDSERRSPILIDVRKPAEYQVSHLPEALNLKTVAEIEDMEIEQNTPLVVYCSIGYRSGRLTEALQSAGYWVLNLEGSVFEWANEERSLVTCREGRERPTHAVHPYNQLWGLLLKAARY